MLNVLIYHFFVSFVTAAVLTHVRHPNIIRLLEVILDKANDEVNFVFEYVQHDLLDLIRFHNRKYYVDERKNFYRWRIDSSVVKLVIFQLATALAYLHANDYIHRYVCLQNTRSETPLIIRLE